MPKFGISRYQPNVTIVMSSHQRDEDYDKRYYRTLYGNDKFGNILVMRGDRLFPNNPVHRLLIATGEREPEGTITPTIQVVRKRNDEGSTTPLGQYPGAWTLLYLKRQMEEQMNENKQEEAA